MTSVRVQNENFDTGAEIAALRGGHTDIGAIAAFIGLMRDFSDGAEVLAMSLEHYPGMTERALSEIAAQAKKRWPVHDAVIIHRVGRFVPGDQIVLVLTAARHRGEAFSACEFIMDYLKTEAPFWKKEYTPNGERWVEARASDESARSRWDDVCD